MHLEIPQMVVIPVVILDVDFYGFPIVREVEMQRGLRELKHRRAVKFLSLPLKLRRTSRTTRLLAAAQHQLTSTVSIGRYQW